LKESITMMTLNASLVLPLHETQLTDEQLERVHQALLFQLATEKPVARFNDYTARAILWASALAVLLGAICLMGLWPLSRLFLAH
jgi:hypothetical protein